jgi:hypothetical protein
LRKWQKFTIDCEGPEQKERKSEKRKKTARTCSPSSNRARVLWGAGASYPQCLAQPNSPPYPYLLSLKPSGKLAVPENSAA